MRKFIYTILLAAAAASCSKNDVVESVVGDAISFGDVFVGNSTKVGADSHTTDNLLRFDVYGNVELNKNAATTVNLYSQVPVTRVDASSQWNYGEQYIQYWLPGCNYKFAAVSDLDAVDASSNPLITVAAPNGLPTSITYNVAAQRDLMYAEVKDVVTDNNGTPKVGSTELANKTVAFTFNHLLSKVQFTFTNAFAYDSGVELTVTDIKITTTAGASATYTIADPLSSSSWGTPQDDATIDFGNTGTMVAVGAPGSGTSSLSSAHCYLIPGTYTPGASDNGTALVITFTVNHNKGGNPTQKEIVMPSTTLEPGYSYNFTAELNSGNVQGVVPIKFNITVDENYSSDPDNNVPGNEGDWADTTI